MQRIVQGATGARDRKSRVHKTREREQDMVMVMVNGAVDGEWYEGQVNPTKSVFQFPSTRLYSPGTPKTVKLKIAVEYE